MTDLSKLYVRNHRYQQHMLIGGAIVALVCGLAPRNERALFAIGDRPAPKAFAAIAPPPAFSGFFDTSEQGRRPAYRFRASPRRPGPVGQVPGALTPSAPSAVTPGEISPVGGGEPVQLASLDPSGTGIPGAPLAGSGPQTFGPSAAPDSVTTPTNPTNPTNPTGPSTPVTPVAPLPEPATWAMMILGFFCIGAALRRNARARSVQLEPVAFEAERLQPR